MIAFLEISVLFEEQWTGIPSVAAALAERALTDTSIDWRFNFETVEIPRDVVRTFLSRRSGGPEAAQVLTDLVWRTPPIARGVAEQAVGVFPGIKPMHRFFRREAPIVYDLTPLLTPQFHHIDNINHFSTRIQLDVDRSDHVFCISDATMQDVHLYLGKPLEDMSLVRLGVEFRPDDLSAARLPAGATRCEDYIAIIGTLEPRKNGRIVLEYLARNPGFASRYRTVFIGRDGWLQEKERLLDVVSKAGVSTDRILFTGFVSERDKIGLILNSRFCVYASFFEGFGLPVLEAAALGKLTVCSNTSSMPEVAPSMCVFFDPTDVDDFAEAMDLAQERSAMQGQVSPSLVDLVRKVEPFGWDHCYGAIAQWVRSQ